MRLVAWIEYKLATKYDIDDAFCFNMHSQSTHFSVWFSSNCFILYFMVHSV